MIRALMEIVGIIGMVLGWALFVFLIVIVIADPEKP